MRSFRNPLNVEVAIQETQTKNIDIVIKDWKTGKEVFNQKEVSVPASWSRTAAQIAASRWFRGKLGTPERETSTFQMFSRVANAICNFAAEKGYFPVDQKQEWIDYLIALQQDQRAVFNTPVYLNAGWTENPRTSACFLLAVEDNYESLTNHTQVEAKVFQHGGGAGVYVGNISHEGRALSRGGYASGPLTFNEGWDRSSGAIKSGGSHRRAARDVTLDVRHPDCYRNAEYLATLPTSSLDTDFIREKQNFEKIRKDLASLGYDVGMNSMVDYVLPAQNANRAVLIYDEFMQAVELNSAWDVYCPRTKEKIWTYPAAEIWDALCYATWYAADPTVKFYNTINFYNMCENGQLTIDGEIHEYKGMVIVTSNPCNEVVYPVPQVSEAAISCNLAMMRLTKYLKEDGEFDHRAYIADVKFMLTLQDALVDYASYPTPLCDQWTKANRILGLSLSDLGGLLMAKGLPYDSAEGREYAGAIAALHFYSALSRSATLAEMLGPCENYKRNADVVDRVLAQHDNNLFEPLRIDAADIMYWAKSQAYIAERLLRQHGLRNMQVVSYAPQGTTGMTTDCFATGPEPLTAPVGYKTLSGGGSIKQTPMVVRIALKHVLEKVYEENINSYVDGTSVDQLAEDNTELAFEYLTTYGTLNGFDDIRTDKYDKIFETALGIHTADGVKLSISPYGHVDMVGQLQKFVSGAISKTVNLPSHYTPKDISDIYFRAWRKGVKAISIYRDGSKGAQPIRITENVEADPIQSQTDMLLLQGEVDRLRAELSKASVPVPAHRVKLPDNVCSVRKKLKLDGHEIYMHVGLFEDGSIGEVFITGIQGTFVAGMLDAFATLFSIGLQYGIPFDDLYRKFEAVSFAPQGFNREIEGYASSLPSLIVKTLRKGFDTGEFKRYASAYHGTTQELEDTVDSLEAPSTEPENKITSDPCSACGSLMIQTGKCKTCVSCGYSNGACG